MIIFLILLLLVLSILMYLKANKIMSGGSRIDRVVVINLDRDKQRYQNFQRQCEIAYIYFDRISAIDGRALDLDSLQKKGLLELGSKSFFNHNKGGRDSLKGSIACALTHKQIWRDFSKHSEETCLIFEDDVVIPEDFWKTFNSISIPSNWDIIFLGGVRIYGRQVSKNLVKAVSTKDNHWNNCGLYAYLINKRSVKKLLEIVDTVKTYIDIQINRHYNNLNVYYIVPNIVKHDFSVKSSRSTGSTQKKGYFYSKNFIDQSKKVTTV